MMQGKHLDYVLDRAKRARLQRLHELFAEVARAQNLSSMAVRDDYYSDDSLYKQDIDSQLECE